MGQLWFPMSLPAPSSALWWLLFPMQMFTSEEAEMASAAQEQIALWPHSRTGLWDCTFSLGQQHSHPSSMTNCARADHEVDLVCRETTLLSVCQQGRREATKPTSAHRYLSYT